jgi:hypothetical protein
MPTLREFSRNGYRPSCGVWVGWKGLLTLGLTQQLGKTRLVVHDR